MFAVFALGIKHVAAHRISAHSIDTSRRSSVEEAAHSKNQTDEPTVVDASGVIEVLDQHAAQQKSKVDEHSAQQNR